MNKELIMKLIERARTSAENAYCPYTNHPIGCSLLVDQNIIFGGCNIENNTLACSAEAGEVAALKAISEGYTKFVAVCFWAASGMPYPSGKVRQLLTEFNIMVHIIVANDDTYSVHTLNELLPFHPEGIEIE